MESDPYPDNPDDTIRHFLGLDARQWFLVCTSLVSDLTVLKVL